MTTDLAPHAYDPELARQLLAEAGYPDGFSTRLAYTTGEREDLAAAIAGQLAAVGIDVELEPVETATFNATWQDPEAAPLRLLTLAPAVRPLHVAQPGRLQHGIPLALRQPGGAGLDRGRRDRARSGGARPHLPRAGRVLHDSPAGIYLWSLTSFYGLDHEAPAWTPRPDDWILPLVVDES